MIRKVFLTLILLLFSFSSVATNAENAKNVKNELVIEDAWIRLGPPIVKTYAGYFSIINLSKNKSLRMIGLESAMFEKVEMHNTSIIDGMMRMERLQYVDLRPGIKVQFSMSGKHLMMTNKKKPIKEGDVIPVKLMFNDDQFMNISMKVRR